MLRRRGQPESNVQVERRSSSTGPSLIVLVLGSVYSLVLVRDSLLSSPAAVVSVHDGSAVR